MFNTCCNFQRNTCQRTCCGQNTTVNTNTTNDCGGFTPVNGVFGVFIPFTNRRCYTHTTTWVGFPNTTNNTTNTTNGGCGCCNLCTTGTAMTPINGDLYYARQYGLYTNGGCGY
jgi:hypothetical protein